MFFKNCSFIIRYCTRNISSTKVLCKSYDNSILKNRIKTTVNYFVGATILTFGLTYAAVPMYRVFCQVNICDNQSNFGEPVFFFYKYRHFLFSNQQFSYGGTVGVNTEKVSEMKPVKHRLLKVKFTADIAAQMAWKFTPLQDSIKLIPGETALAFYTATNPTDQPICGISTYNIVPFEVGMYFNKIQCFCFEEQMLNPHESVRINIFYLIL